MTQTTQTAPDTRRAVRPDPIVTANIYCGRMLDDVLREVVVPFWSQVRALDGGDSCYIWFTRYAKGGEHLKVRVHGPEPLRGDIGNALESQAKAYLDSIANEPPKNRLSKPVLRPVDPEDEVEQDYPDRSMLWTTFRRSPVIMGDDRYTRDETHTALFTRGMGEIGEIMVTRLAPQTANPGYAQVRQNLYLKMLILGIGVMGFDRDGWITYLTYHRNWLVRHNVGGGVEEREILELFDQRLEKMGRALEAVSRLVAAQIEGNDGGSALDDWRSRASALFSHVAGYRGRSEYDVDPYTTDFAHLPMFKLFHGGANQLGYRTADEAFLHHLLLRAAERLPASDPRAAGA